MGAQRDACVRDVSVLRLRDRVVHHYQIWKRDGEVGKGGGEGWKDLVADIF